MRIKINKIQNWVEVMFYLLVVIEFFVNFNFSYNRNYSFDLLDTLFGTIANYFDGYYESDYYDYLLFPIIVLSIIILYLRNKYTHFIFYRHTIIFSKSFIFIGIIRFIYEFLTPRLVGPLF